MGKQGIIKILPFKSMKGGLVVTGSEVFSGRIKDGSPIVEERLKKYGLEMSERSLRPMMLAPSGMRLRSLFEKGADLVITTGGLSVDPDDVTKEGVAATGARTVLYGAPVFPGAMFLVARRKGKVYSRGSCVRLL